MEYLEVDNKYVVAFTDKQLKLNSKLKGKLYFDTTGGTKYEFFDTEEEMNDYIKTNNLKTQYTEFEEI